jgi:hypothetical protein
MPAGPARGVSSVRRKSLLVIALLAVLLLAAFACWPRRADLRAFDSAGMARLETAMWRDYYEKRYGALFYHLYELSRTQFGFSPSDSFRLALAAASAAKRFSRPARAARRLRPCPSSPSIMRCCARRRPWLTTRTS